MPFLEKLSLMFKDKASGLSEKENRELLDAVKEVCEQHRLANMAFDYARSPELVEASVYEIKALQARYSYLLRLAREQGAQNMEFLKLPR